MDLRAQSELRCGEGIKRELGLNGLLLMYIGSLEQYQGIDLLLESFAAVLDKTGVADLVIIGGRASDIYKYRKKAIKLGIERKVHFLGPKPLGRLGEYLSQADVLVSPRITGKNTPMKIYSYLHSGKAVLATDLPTHTQVLDSQVAVLGGPSPESFSRAILRLIEDRALRMKLGTAGKRLAEEKYTYTVFREKIHGLFDWLEVEVTRERRV